MTLIECFDRTVLENIAGTLYLRPDKLVIVGDADNVSAFLPLLTGLLSKRNISTEIQLCDTSGMTIRQIANALAEIVSREDRCIIDLTGGEEPVIMAVGAMLADLEDRQKVSVQKFSLLNPKATDCDRDGQAMNGCCTYLTVEELIALHGGTVHPALQLPSARYTPDSVKKLWNIVADAPKDWNNRISVLSEFEKRSDSKDDIDIPLHRLKSEIKNYKEKETAFLELLNHFIRNGIIEDSSSRSAFRYRYTSELYRDCTKKAGNALELKTLLEARAVTENGQPYFDDCAMGITIYWGGTPQIKSSDLSNTHNEIDLILTKGLLSLFISCKNGFIEEDELYKLHTVAERFGGPYAKKMLIATDLDQKAPASTRAFIQRARDMNIMLVTDAAQLEPNEWQNIFRSAML